MNDNVLLVAVVIVALLAAAVMDWDSLLARITYAWSWRRRREFERKWQTAKYQVIPPPAAQRRDAHGRFLPR
jgi:hypothetical protein